jgi:hypothetical protein
MSTQNTRRIFAADAGTRTAPERRFGAASLAPLSLTSCAACEDASETVRIGLCQHRLGGAVSFLSECI